MYDNDLRGPGLDRAPDTPTYDVRAADARTAFIILVLVLAMLVGTLAVMAGFITIPVL